MKRLCLSIFPFLLILAVSSANAQSTLALQEKCARRAQERFEQEFDYAHYHYQNHYNKKDDKCFMWVWSLDGARIQYVYDVNEKLYYGILIIGVAAPTDFRCRILEKRCKSEAEWDAFVKSYMKE